MADSWARSHSRVFDGMTTVTFRRDYGDWKPGELGYVRYRPKFGWDGYVKGYAENDGEMRGLSLLNVLETLPAELHDEVIKVHRNGEDEATKQVERWLDRRVALRREREAYERIQLQEI